MGLSILTGGALLLLPLHVPWLLYAGGALFGLGCLLLGIRLLQMMLS
ncbi:MAG: hypothetical protein IT530_21150 [Burkholderiales bacterium]|nr:hypothetical protein [Burkholderiales bacterium]